MVKAPPKSITLRVSSYGFRLLGYQMRNTKPIQIDVKRSARQLERDKNIYYWLPNLYRDELQAQVDAQTSLLRLEPDTVFFVLSDRVKKRVPVINKVELQFADGYKQYQSYKLEPAFITVSGPQVYIDSIEQVDTEVKKISNINGDVKESVAIDFERQLVTVSPGKVNYLLDVDQFTEKVVQLPIKIKNIPPNSKVEIYPALVEVHVKVALRDYDSLNANTISASCDIDQLIDHPSRERLKVTIETSLPRVEIIRVSYQSVDYLIY